jgi:hypothetical protein
LALSRDDAEVELGQKLFLEVCGFSVWDLELWNTQTERRKREERKGVSSFVWVEVETEHFYLIRDTIRQ